MNEIKARLDALPHRECKWKPDDHKVADFRDRPIADITAFAMQPVRDFIVNAPEDVACLLAEVGRLETEAAALREALEGASDAVAELGDGRLAEETGNADWRGLSARIEAALAADAGRILLERLRRAEHERDEKGEMLNEVVISLRAAGLDDSAPPGKLLWDAARERIKTLERERDEAQAILKAIREMQRITLDMAGER